MERSQKRTAVEGLTSDLGEVAAVFALDYRGIKVSEVTEFRSKIREAGATYRVVKNTLLRRALEGTGVAAIEPSLSGMTGLAFTTQDPVALAKVIHDFAKDVPAVSYKGGVLDEKVLDPAQFEALAKLPSKESLQSQLLSVLQAPIRNLLSVLQAPSRDLILVLKAKADQG